MGTASSEPEVESTMNRDGVALPRDLAETPPAAVLRRTELVAFGRPKFATINVKLSSFGRD